MSGVPAACAEDYRTELNLTYLGPDYDAQFFTGIFHFSEVDTQNSPLAEAGFLTRSSNVVAGAIFYDGGHSQFVLAEIFLGDFFYVRPSYTRFDDPFDEGNQVDVALGITPVDGLVISTTVPEEDYEVNVAVKYVTGLGGDRFFNVTAYFEDGGSFDDNFGLEADYYFDRTPARH